VPPAYPPYARSLRIQGNVRVGAVIGKDGVPRNLKILSGDPRLIDSALAAIRQWRYSPATLDGEAVESQTEITVSFALN